MTPISVAGQMKFRLRKKKFARCARGSTALSVALFWLGISAASFFATAARADFMHCVAIAMAPCNCKAALIAKCDGAIGNLDNGQKVESLVMHVRTRSGAVKTVPIRKPGLGIANYFPMNDDAREEVSRASGLILGAEDRGYVGEFTLDKGAQFYQDEDETALASRRESDCGYLKRPEVASLVSNPGGAHICFGQVRCGPHRMEVACSGSPSAECPSADDCIDDTSVRLEKAKVSAPVGGASETSAQGGAGGAR